jgi:hypothetical protein
LVNQRAESCPANDCTSVCLTTISVLH